MIAAKQETSAKSVEKFGQRSTYLEGMATPDTKSWRYYREENLLVFDGLISDLPPGMFQGWNDPGGAAPIWTTERLVKDFQIPEETARDLPQSSEAADNRFNGWMAKEEKASWTTAGRLTSEKATVRLSWKFGEYSSFLQPVLR